MDVNIGIIGHGFMGHVHEEMLTRMDGYHVVAICDKDDSQLADVKTGIKKYTNPDDLIHDADINVVLIAANNNQHKELVCKAARAGKNILCEKPAALSVKDFDEMTFLTQEYNVQFTVHQQRRFDPDFRTIKNIYDSGTLGKAYTVKSSLYGFNGNMHDWHVFKSEGGGMLYDWGVHLIDQMVWMIDGKIKTIYADIRNVINKEVDDYFKILLHFENGVTAEIELGTYMLSDKPGWFERHWFIGGDKGAAYTDGFDPDGKIVKTTRLLQNVAHKRTMTASGPTRSFGPPEEGLLIEEDIPIAQTKHEDYFRNYYNAVNGKENFLVTIPQVRRVLCIMEAARNSAVTGHSIDFE
jgi:scyllo-inositol 2-dehydrogenase (NADP+)